MADTYKIPSAPHTGGGPISGIPRFTATSLVNLHHGERPPPYNDVYPHFLKNVPASVDGCVTARNARTGNRDSRGGFPQWGRRDRLVAELQAVASLDFCVMLRMKRRNCWRIDCRRVGFWEHGSFGTTPGRPCPIYLRNLRPVPTRCHTASPLPHPTITRGRSCN